MAQLSGGDAPEVARRNQVAGDSIPSLDQSASANQSSPPRTFTINSLNDLPQLFELVLQRPPSLRAKINRNVFTDEEYREVVKLIEAMKPQSDDRQCDVAERIRSAARDCSKLEQNHAQVFQEVSDGLFTSALQLRAGADPSALVEVASMTARCGTEFYIRSLQDLPRLFDEVLKKPTRLHVKIDQAVFTGEERKDIATLIRAMILRDGDRASDVAARLQLAARTTSLLAKKYEECFGEEIQQLFQLALNHIPKSRRVEVIRRFVVHDTPAGSKPMTDKKLAERIVENLASQSGSLRELHVPHIRVVGPDGTGQRVRTVAKEIKQELANRANAQPKATPLGWIRAALHKASSWFRSKPYLQAS
jgi:hypothetical protein